MTARTLDQVIASGPFPTQQAAAIASQIATQLVALHTEVHLRYALTPDTIVLADDGTVLLLDRNVAGWWQGEAPELWPQGTSIDSGPDVYSLGIIIKSLVLGENPPHLSMHAGALGSLEDLALQMAETDPGARPWLRDAAARLAERAHGHT
ncbi:hypothetical protein EDD29_0039 [Actinocorallia herbida]|uniref:Protein kinase domain-containing protein n=1 Tax=Actinocorallia herbida TaxID=58109 RepID=A0A3N1CML9_9ACTN|nr:hypothetical protein [Actinocorallia herbida]ROO82559.1 hypothetical protein EDD29_0039 [Actinocorallia herbida]